MRSRRPALLFAVRALLAVPIVACSGSPEAESQRWESRIDRTSPSLADAADCRTQAQRQAATRYPPRVLDVPSGSGGRMTATLPSANPDQLEVENWLYRQCMRQKGFELVTTTR